MGSLWAHVFTRPMLLTNIFIFLQAWFNYSSERFGPDGSEVQRLWFLARKRANMLIATQSRLKSNCRLFNDYTLISLCCKIKQIFCAGLSLVWLSYSWMLWPNKYNILFLEYEVLNVWSCRLNFWNTITSFQIYVTPCSTADDCIGFDLSLIYFSVPQEIVWSFSTWRQQMLLHLTLDKFNL